MNRKLQDLHNELISKGCNLFFIDGIGGPIDSDVEHLGFFDPNWEVYYSERGQKGKVFLSTPDISEAIAFYRKHILSIEHWHLIAFTRSADVLEKYRFGLEKVRIKTIQNDLPDYSQRNDRIYRLFVVNKSIFEALRLFPEVPFFDENLTHFGTY
ncbi:hypothetical protein [Flavobacterium sp.]|uniref:hypothetical protein n=1 Tax=Flavobacterium sp. TaxID=239 RepID=UPI00121DF4A4|nr:hypothetical protein [Flavobacterium sp.]RZJ70108.1 MAG: hypothetical protein EOO49_14860 [Flavobacterium sp.]